MNGWDGDLSSSMVIVVKVKPGAKVGPKMVLQDDGTYVAYVRARAHDGEANAALIELASDYFGVAKSSVEIKSGRSSRTKLIELL